LGALYYLLGPLNLALIHLKEDQRCSDANACIRASTMITIKYTRVGSIVTARDGDGSQESRTNNNVTAAGGRFIEYVDVKASRNQYKIYKHKTGSSVHRTPEIKKYAILQVHVAQPHHRLEDLLSAACGGDDSTKLMLACRGIDGAGGFS